MEIQKIAIRVDASNQIGTGHFMRCLTLADALKQLGAQIRFLCRYLPDYLRDMLEVNGHSLMVLNTNSREEIPHDLDHAEWLGTSQQTDAQDTIYAMSDQIWDWLIIDHYAIDVRWESMLRHTVKKIFVIDDIADRQHDCDVLLDQNMYADMNIRYDGKVPPYCKLLLGPRYAILRDEFRQVRNQIKTRTGPVNKILVFFGGVDIANYTSLAIEVLSRVTSYFFSVDVVIGSKHPHQDQIVSKCTKFGFSCYVQTNRMAELMAIADLAIGAGGSASWERCCLGLPTLTLSVANNQKAMINDSAKIGLLYTYSSDSNDTIVMWHHLHLLLKNQSLRALISQNGMKAVDGRGLIRVLRNIRCNTAYPHFA